MKKRTILAVFALFSLCAISSAQELDVTIPDPAKPKRGLIGWFKDWRDSSLIAGRDTSYISVPSRKWMITTGLKSNSSAFSIYWPSATEMAEQGNPGKIFDNFDSYTYHYTAKPTLGIAIGLAYKGFGLTISPKVINKEKGKGLDIGLGLTGTTFGGDIAFKGLFDSDGEGNDYFLASASLSGYYVLNNKKFNLTAAFSQSVMQKKSAGSVILATRLGFSSLVAVETPTDEIKDGAYGTNGTWSLGAGYGYNFVFAQSHFLIHASYIPMFMILQGSRYGYYDDLGNHSYVKSKQNFVIPYSHMARFAFYYTWRDRYLIGGSLQDSHYGWKYAEKQPNAGTEWTALLFFKFRL